MKLKWYISALVIVLTLLGLGQHQITVPNQEIVVQFSKDASSEVTHDAIIIVKKQLQSIGADNIQIHKNSSGLRITYYSNVDVASIKTLLGSYSLEFDYTSSNPTKNSSEENSKKFNLDVFEIQKSNRIDIDFEGFVLEQKPETPRYYNPNFYFSNISLDIKEKHKIEVKKYNVQKSIAIAIDNISRIIPEVRAGPLA